MGSTERRRLMGSQGLSAYESQGGGGGEGSGGGAQRGENTTTAVHGASDYP